MPTLVDTQTAADGWWLDNQGVVHHASAATGHANGWLGPYATRDQAQAAAVAAGGGDRGGGSGGGPPGGGSGGGGKGPAAFLASALTYLGQVSVLGALDCSHLVQLALQRIGVTGVPRTSEEQWQWVDRISQSQLRPGDLIFEQWPGDFAPPGHVVIYAGKGQVIEAPATGAVVHERAWSPTETTIIGYGRVPSWAGAGAGAGGVGGGVGGPGGIPWESYWDTTPVGAAQDAAQGAGGISGAIAGLGSTIGAFVGFLSSLDAAVTWLLSPSNWVRIVCDVGGGILVLGGVWTLTHVGGDLPGAGPVGAGAALPVGIFMVGAGGILLFIGFHNLPSSVTGISSLLGHLSTSIPQPAVAP